jgi:predicted nucleic acid-binding protein
MMELANALRYSSEFSSAEIAEALETLFDLNILLIPFSLEALNSAVSLSLERDLAVYDAYFLALAQALGIPLITADRKMLSRLPPRGRDPEPQKHPTIAPKGTNLRQRSALRKRCAR